MERSLLPREKLELKGAILAMVRRRLGEGNWVESEGGFRSRAACREMLVDTVVDDLRLSLMLRMFIGLRFDDVDLHWQKSQAGSGTTFCLPWTIRCDRKRWNHAGDDYYDIHCLDDIAHTEMAVRSFVEGVASRFWSHFVAIGDLDREWNNRPHHYDLDLSDSFSHAVKSVIVARLARNANYEEIVNIRRKEIDPGCVFCPVREPIVKFDRLVEYLSGVRG